MPMKIDILWSGELEQNTIITPSTSTTEMEEITCYVKKTEFWN